MRKKNLTASKNDAIALILTGMQYPDVAKQVGVTVPTLTRWRSEPEFQRAIEDGLAQIRQQAIVQISALHADAIAALKAVLSKPIEGETISPGVAIRAAATVLSYGTQLRGEIGSERLKELEEGLSEATERSDTVVPLSRAPRGWRFN